MPQTPAQLRNLLKACYDEREAAALARAVCCGLLGQRVADYVLNEPLPADEETADKVSAVVERLLRYEPLQYIEGKARFGGRDFRVAPGVLIPRPETEELVERLLKVTPRGARILDVGTGSGCIAVTLALEVADARVEAWDISADALSVARANNERYEAGVALRQVDVLAGGDWGGERRFDLIVSNPPYITEAERKDMLPNVLRYEPDTALFVPDADPLRFYRRIGQLGQRLLLPGGRIAFEINRAFGRQMAELLQEQGYADVRIDRDLSGNDRFATGLLPLS